MSFADTIPLMLLALLGLALGMGIIYLSLIYALHRRAYYLGLKLAAGGTRIPFCFFHLFSNVRQAGWPSARSTPKPFSPLWD